MSLSLFLGLLGIVVSVIFGMPTFLNWLKKKKNNISLSFSNEQSYLIFKDDVKRLSITIKHNEKELSNPIILFKGKLTNDGLSDIDKIKISRPLELSVNSMYSILDVKLIQIPENSKININKISGLKIQFNWDLLKVGESINFEILVEVIVEKKDIKFTELHFYKNIKFDYRITDLNAINKIDNINPQKKMNLFTKIFMVYLFSSSFILGIYNLIRYIDPTFYNPIYINTYNLNDGKKDINNVYIYNPIKPNLLQIRYSDNTKIWISVKDFNNRYVLKKINVTTDLNQNIIELIAGIVSLLFFIFLCYGFYIDWEEKKIEKGKLEKLDEID